MDSTARVSVIIPARNEAGRIGGVVREALPRAFEVLVVDDASTDETALEARSAGARVIAGPGRGYIEAIKAGFRAASGEVVVTCDGDGEHDPADIPALVAPIAEGRADLVLGKRPEVARLSERLIAALVSLKAPVKDTGTGFRALRRGLALRLTMPGRCICGTSVLEALALGARVAEVPVMLRGVAKPRRIAWQHAGQLLLVLSMLIRGMKNRTP